MGKDTFKMFLIFPDIVMLLQFIVTQQMKILCSSGLLTEVNIPIDPVSRQMKGFGTVTFLMPEHAVKAYAELDGSILHGRMLHLLPGKAKDTVDSQIEGNFQDPQQD